MEMVENADKLRTRNADTTTSISITSFDGWKEVLLQFAICNNTSILKNPLLLEFY
jgi:hypothetical protein